MDRAIENNGIEIDIEVKGRVEEIADGFLAFALILVGEHVLTELQSPQVYETENCAMNAIKAFADGFFDGLQILGPTEITKVENQTVH